MIFFTSFWLLNTSFSIIFITGNISWYGHNVLIFCFLPWYDDKFTLFLICDRWANSSINFECVVPFFFLFFGGGDFTEFVLSNVDEHNIRFCDVFVDDEFDDDDDVDVWSDAVDGSDDTDDVVDDEFIDDDDWIKVFGNDCSW